ncbi:hypothetical protein Btru_046120 [Bulinus truncatus]|nr:hypothetical protein Btru_046120 [Bulinus truncatus]
MAETPLTSDVDRSRMLHVYTPFSERFTPGTVQSQAKKSRKLIAPITVNEESVEYHDYAGILKKTWRLYSMSPLYNFKSNHLTFKKYARSLDAALAGERCSFADSSEGLETSSFSIYKGLKFSASDPEAVQIQIVGKKSADGQKSNTVLNALMICVDVEHQPVPAAIGAHFTYYPVVMVMGNKLRSSVLLNWLERHFDCHTSPFLLSSNDLRWLLACCSTKDIGPKAVPVLLQYSLQNLCEGISTIDCTFESSFCKALWERIHNSSTPPTSVEQDDVDRFVEALESHLEYTMHIVFSKLSLSEVGTPLAYVSSQGKIKLFTSEGIFLALHLLCSVANDRFMELKSVWKKPSDNVKC